MAKNIIGGIALVIFILWIWFIPNNNTFKDSHVSEADAVITSIGTGCGSSYSVVKFRYTANKVQYENWTCYSHTQRMNSNFEVGKAAKACYDPNNHQDSSVIPLDYQCRNR